MTELKDARSLLAFITEQRAISGISEAALIRKSGVNTNLIYAARKRDSDIRLGNAIALINALGFTVTITPTDGFRAMQSDRKDAA